MVSKSVGGAVVRNRVKRRLRAQMSARLTQLPLGSDIVIRANSSAAQANSLTLAVDLDRLVPKVTRSLTRVST